MRARALCGAVGLLAAVGWLAAPAAQAQDVRVTAPFPADESQQPLNSDESDALGRALVFDPSALTNNKPARTLKRRDLSGSANLDIKTTGKPDGSSSVAVKQPLSIDSPDFDSQVGADLNLAGQAPNVPGRPLPGSTPNESAAAWASVGVHNLASVDARLDPTSDQGKIGGKLNRALPVGQDVSVTLEDSYSVTDSFSARTTTAAPQTTSSLAAPAPATAAAPVSTQVFDNARSVKFNVAPTGTTFGAGWTTASNDPVTHNTLSADQKLFGPLHVTTSVTDVGQPSENKTITAGFKLNW